MFVKAIKIFVCSLFCLSCGYSADVIRIQGSDLFGEALIESIQQFDHQHPGEVMVEFNGSVPAMANLRRGEADLAIVAIPDGEAKDEEQYTYIPFAFKVSLVAVGKENPLTEMSLRQLAGVYGRSAESNITRWGELGLTGSWAVRSIQIYTLRSETGIHQSLFEHMVLRGGALRPTVGYIDHLDRAGIMLSNDPGAMALLPALPRSGALRALALSSSGEGSGFAFSPSEENIYHGDYPLRLPFYLVFPKGKKAEFKDVVRHFLSQNVAEDLKSEGFVAVPRNLRRSLLLELDN